MTAQASCNPCLLAVILTVSTHRGPQLVFHYPPNPDPNNYEADFLEDNDLQDDSEDSEEYSYGSSNDDSSDGEESASNSPDNRPRNLLETLRGRQRSRTNNMNQPNIDAITSLSDSTSFNNRMASSSRTREAPEGDSIVADQETTALGFDMDFLSELLCPPRSMCNTQFEMAVDEMAFIGIPIHVLPDGQWRRRKKGQPGSRTANSTVVPRSNDEENESNGNGNGNGNDDREDEIYHSESDGSDADDNIMSDADAEGDYNDPHSPMRMFHINFVMNPSLTDFLEKTSQMYHFVLSQFVSTLRTEQARSNYVWEQVTQITNLKDKHSSHMTRKELWKEILETSNLASAIGDLFHNISLGQIANIDINNKVRSFQIPPQREFERLPSLTEPKAKGAFLTTASTKFTMSVMTNRANDYPDGVKLFGILLLDDAETIIRDMHADAYASLAEFIRAIDPTETIEALALRNGRNTQRVIELAQSLVYWRRARFITPISHKNTFAVSPLADMANINDHSIKFKDQFPELPLSLPKLLSMLSTGKTRPYANHIPSRDHQDIYVSALAWLMRRGFVIQLLTFAYLRIPKRIKADVNRDIQIENDMADYEQGAVRRAKKNTDTSTDNTTKRGEIAGSPKGKGVQIPGPLSTLRAPTGSALPSSLGAQSNNSDADTDPSADLDDTPTEESILLDPSRATAIEKRWISMILKDRPTDQKLLFNRLLKYLNGSNSIEEALVLENISRMEWKRFRTVFDQYLSLVRHW